MTRRLRSLHHSFEAPTFTARAHGFTGSSIAMDANLKQLAARRFNDGYNEPTAWAAPQDGVLVLDLNAAGNPGPDGKITHLNEIVFTRWFQGAKTDLMGLRKALDGRREARAP